MYGCHQVCQHATVSNIVFCLIGDLFYILLILIFVMLPRIFQQIVLKCLMPMQEENCFKIYAHYKI